MGDAATVAVLGMGNMGAAMARRLAGAEFTLRLYNRTEPRAQTVAAEIGADVAGSPIEAVRGAAIVISSVADDDAVIDLFLGKGDALSGLGAGTTVLEMSTIDPRTVHRLGEAIDATGAVLVDAPVSGSVPLVEQGTLTIMAGGPRDAVEGARPVLDRLAARVFHVGARGAGATIKLAVNAIVHATNVAVSEALVLAERSGVERSAAYEVFAASAVGSPFVAYKRGAFEDPGTAPVAFSLDLVAKDYALIAGLADNVGAPMRQLEASRRVVLDAVAAGLGTSDMSIVAEYLRRVSSDGD